jgi:iron(III) transport system permease protein
MERLILVTVAVMLAALGLAPLLAVLVGSFVADHQFTLNAYEGLLSSSNQPLSSMSHSIVLSLLTATVATVVGVPLGILIGRTDLPLRRTLAASLTIPLALPPYVIAAAWSAALGGDGLVGRALAPAVSQRLSSILFGLGGCVWVLSAAFMPVQMLLTAAYAGAVDPRLEDAGRLVTGWPGVLRGITLPLARPAILLAAVLILLLTFAETGVPMFLRYPVYPIEILTQFAAFYDFGSAAATAAPVLLFALVALLLEYRFLHRPVLELSPTTQAASQARLRLGSWRFPLLALALAWSLVSVLLPLAALIFQSLSPMAYIEAFARAGDSIIHSLELSAIGATLLTVLGFFGGYLVHHRTLASWRAVDMLALLSFALPGAVIGVGLIGLWNTPTTNIVYRTPAIMLLGYLTQYVVLPMRITAATLARIPRAAEQAARLCGATWLLGLWLIVMPLACRGLIVAWAAGYVACLRDLGVSFVTYPPGFDTLPVRMFTLMANGAPSLIAALCIILIAVTLLPVGLMGLWLSNRAWRP